MKKKIFLSILIHLIAAGFFSIAITIPAVNQFIKNTEFRSFGSAPLGMALLVLPAIFITFVWYPRAFKDGARWRSEANVWTKVKLSLLLISQVIVTLAYLIFLTNLLYY